MLQPAIKPLVTKNQNGTITVSAIINNQRIHRIYSGYTAKQALTLFKSLYKEDIK